MRAIRFLYELLSPPDLQKLDVGEVVTALNDSSIRAHWLKAILNEIQDINIAIDSDLLQKRDGSLRDRSVQRRTLQFVLEQVLASKRAVEGQGVHKLPLAVGQFDLDKLRS